MVLAAVLRDDYMKQRSNDVADCFFNGLRYRTPFLARRGNRLVSSRGALG